MPTPPSLSPEQREAALEKAAAARRVRAETKDRLKMGLVSFDELLELADTDELVGKMKALAALESMPKIGKVKARRLMRDVGIAESRRLQGLGENQRTQLVDFFAAYLWLAERHGVERCDQQQQSDHLCHLRRRWCWQGNHSCRADATRFDNAPQPILDYTVTEA